MKYPILIGMILALNAAAGESDRIGNGGDALVCPDRVEMLDVYQAREDLRLSLNEQRGGETHEKIVGDILKKIHAQNPSRAQRFSSWWATFSREVDWVSGKKLIDIPDTGHQSIPRQCELQQIAVQNEDGQRLPHEKRYTIDLDLWKRMNEFSRAALVIHELVYRERLEQRSWQGSPFVRYLTAHLISEDLARIDYHRLLLASRVALFEGIAVNGHSAQEVWANYESGYDKSGAHYLDVNFMLDPVRSGRIDISGWGNPQFPGVHCLLAKQRIYDLAKISANDKVDLIACNKTLQGWVKVDNEWAQAALGFAGPVDSITMYGDGRFSGFLSEKFYIPSRDLVCEERNYLLVETVNGRATLTCKLRDKNGNGIIGTKWEIQVEDHSVTKP